MSQHTPIFIRPSAVPALYGISRATLYRWAEKGIVKIHKQGNCAFVRREEMDAAITGEPIPEDSSVRQDNGENG